MPDTPKIKPIPAGTGYHPIAVPIDVPVRPEGAYWAAVWHRGWTRGLKPGDELSPKHSGTT